MAVPQTRPKSSKGRRRSSAQTPDVFQRDADEESSAARFHVGGRDAPVRPQPKTRHSERAGGAGGAPSLNKYTVLPSIERGRNPGHPCAGEELPGLTVTGSRRVQQLAEACVAATGLTAGTCGSSGPAPGTCGSSGAAPGTCGSSGAAPGTCGSSGPAPGTCSSGGGREVVPSSHTLLLAIRDPSGRRFQRRFDTSDTLLRVRTSAEAEYGVKFRENATIQTMEVPRRIFTDMKLTLGQCGISDRSVLCVSQPQDQA